MALDLDHITTVEEAEGVMDTVIDSWDDEDYFQLLEHRDRLQAREDATRTPAPLPKPKPDRSMKGQAANLAKHLDEVERRIGDFETTIAAARAKYDDAVVNEASALRNAAYVDRKILSNAIDELNEATEWEQLDASALDRAFEDAAIAFEDSQANLDGLPDDVPGYPSAKRTRAQREYDEALSQRARIQREINRRHSAIERARGRERAVAETSELIVGNLVDRALAQLRKTPGLKPWEFDTANAAASKIKASPWDKGVFGKDFENRVGAVVRAEIEAKAAEGARNLAATGNWMVTLGDKPDASGRQVDRIERLATQLTGTGADDGRPVPDHMDGSFVNQLAHALLGPAGI